MGTLEEYERSNTVCWWPGIISTGGHHEDKEGHIKSNRNQLQLPAKYTEYEIEHEKRSDDDERNKIHPVVRAAQGIVGLQSIHSDVGQRPDEQCRAHSTGNISKTLMKVDA